MHVGGELWPVVSGEHGQFFIQGLFISEDSQSPSTESAGGSGNVARHYLGPRHYVLVT